MNLFSQRLLVGAMMVSGTCGAATAAVTWKATESNLTISFNESLMKGYGIRLVSVNQTGIASDNVERGIGFKGLAAETTLRLKTDNGIFEGWGTGGVKFDGGFSIASGDRTISFQRPKLIPMGEAGDSPMILIGDSRSEDVFSMEVVTPTYGFKGGKFGIQRASLQISRDMAYALNNPGLANAPVGVLQWNASVTQESGQNSPVSPTPVNNNVGRTAGPDVGLWAMSSLTAAGRTGTYPNGMNGLSCLTTSCGEGTQTVSWKPPQPSIGATMFVDHPVIVQSVYMTRNGRFEQVGEGWLKHGWYATNAGTCSTGVCSPAAPGDPNPGWNLRPGCTDTYDAGHNADRTYLGPKSEVNPFTGVWTAEGSYFSGGVMDRIRRTNGSQKYNPATSTSVAYTYSGVENRVQVSDTDLVNPGTLIYEAFYISPGDPDTFNSMGWRTASRTWNSAQNRWTFASLTNMVQGPAINQWGDMRVNAQPENEGIVIVAVKVNQLSSSIYEYDYAVYNHNNDRQIKSFSIPLDYNKTIVNRVFRDTDTNAANDWAFTHTGGQARWDALGSSNFNGLMYCRTFNFRLTVAADPATVTLGMLPWKSGTNLSYGATITGPAPGPIPVSGTVGLDTGYVGGNQSLVATLRPVAGGPSITSSVTHDAVAGTFSLNTTARGSFYISLDGNTWLKREATNPITISGAGPTTGISLSLPNGDADGSGEVAPGDLQIILDNFGNMVDPASDLDRDGECGPGDLQIVIDNFGLSDD